MFDIDNFDTLAPLQFVNFYRHSDIRFSYSSFRDRLFPKFLLSPSSTSKRTLQPTITPCTGPKLLHNLHEKIMFLGRHTPTNSSFQFRKWRIEGGLLWKKFCNMLPLSHKDTLHRGFGSRIKEKLNGWMRLIFSDRNSRNLFLFLLLNLSFAFVELAYGIWTNSLGE